MQACRKDTLYCIERPGFQDEQLLGQAIDGLPACGPDAASEAVPALAKILRDRRVPVPARVIAGGTLQWLGLEAMPVAADLAGILADSSEHADVRNVAARALISSGQLLVVLPGQVPDAHRQAELLSILRGLGAEATAVRRQLQASWAEETPATSPASAPAPVESPATANDSGQPAPEQPNEQLDKIKAALSRLEQRLEKPAPPPPEKSHYTVREAAEATGYGEWTLRQACNKGRVQADKGPDGKWRISRAQITRIVNEGLPG
jgi:hypothetical protein